MDSLILLLSNKEVRCTGSCRYNEYHQSFIKMAEKTRVHWHVQGRRGIQGYKVVNLLERRRFGCPLIGPEPAAGI
jgi:hypothetical protein